MRSFGPSGTADAGGSITLAGEQTATLDDDSDPLGHDQGHRAEEVEDVDLNLRAGQPRLT
jgi:hypothetical protein